MGDPVFSKMDIDRGGIQGFMAKQRFDGEQIRSIFVKMGTKSMAERMAGEPMFQAKGGLHGIDELVDSKRSHWQIRMPGIGKRYPMGLPF